MIIALKIILTPLVALPAILLIIWIPRLCMEDINLPHWYLTLTDVLYTAWCCEAVIVVFILVLVMFTIVIISIWRM